MKRLFQICSLALLAACVAGCGKDPATNAETLAAPVEKPDFDTLMRTAVDGIAQKDADAAASASAQALALQPESAEAHLLAGQAACLRQDYDEARAQFTSVIKAKSLPAALRAKAYVGLGTVDFVQHDADAARFSFLQARRLDSRNEAAWYYLGMIYRDTCRFTEAALEQFQIFARLSRPDEPHAESVVRKVIPDLRAAIQRAAAEIPGAATRKPEAAAKLLAEAQELEEKKRLAQAKKKYAAAFEADPLSYPVALGYARLLKRTETTAEGVDKALLAYRAVIDQRPAVQKNSLEAARLAYANRRWATAVRIMDRAVAHDPQNKESIDVLIGALMKAGNDKLAKAWGEYRKDLGR